MANDKKGIWKKHYDALKKAAQDTGIATKGKSGILDRLKQRSADDINQMIGYMEDEGYTLDMIGELYSRKWVSDKRKSGGQQGHFKTQKQKEMFERRAIDNMVKEHQKQLRVKKKKDPNIKTPLATPQEKRKLRNLPYKQAKNKIDRNQVYDPTLRQEQYSKFTKKMQQKTKGTDISLTKKEEQLEDNARQYNEEMGVVTIKHKKGSSVDWYYNLSSENGFAVMYHMEVTGATKLEAMQRMVYDKADALNEKYTIPTEIPNGISVTGEGFDAINDQRALIGLPAIKREDVKFKTL